MNHRKSRLSFNVFVVIKADCSEMVENKEERLVLAENHPPVLFCALLTALLLVLCLAVSSRLKSKRRLKDLIFFVHSLWMHRCTSL